MPTRVLIAEFMHETNTFSVQKTDRSCFLKRGLYLQNEVVAEFTNTRTFIGAGFEAAQKFGWNAITPLVADATPSGRVTDAAFEEFTAMLLGSATKVDGILLHLHGSMSTESYDDGEGELLERIRAVTGKDIPIIVVLDLHATVTQRMADNSNALISYRTYPHIDQYERGHQAAALLDRAIRGEIKPKVAIARRPILYAMDGGRTASGPMAELLKRADALEASGEALVVSIQAGFSSADVQDIGPSIAVTAENEAKAQSIAEELMDYVWQERHWSTINFTPLEEAIAEAAKLSLIKKPLIISDYSDNPGSGAYGDATTLLRAILQAGLKNVGFHAICDPEAALKAQDAGVGNKVRLMLGGKVDPATGGAPIEITAEVVTLSNGRFIAYGPMGGGTWRNHGLSALLRVGTIDIIVITNNAQATDLAQFTFLGVDPLRKSTLIVKSMQHFRAAFEPIARQVIEVDTGALSTKNFFARPFKNIRRPIWPLDDIQ